MRYQKKLTILNKDFKKKDHLQNSKQNYFFSNLIEMQRTHIFIHLFRVWYYIEHKKTHIKLKGVWFYFYFYFKQDTDFVLTNHDIPKFLHCISALYTSWRHFKMWRYTVHLLRRSNLKIITCFGDVFPVINQNRLTWARRTVEKKVRKPDKSEVIKTKP